MRNDSPISVLLNDEVLETSRYASHTSVSSIKQGNGGGGGVWLVMKPDSQNIYNIIIYVYNI